MHRLGELLRERAEVVVERWFADVLADYPSDAATAFGRERDRFANPVGHSLREGTRSILAALVNGADAESLRTTLDEIVRVRAVQQFAIPAAVGFLFRLKPAIRTVLADALDDPGIARELRELDDRIDEAALIAFDIFVQCRERVCELRINELKRNIPWVAGRMGQA